MADVLKDDFREIIKYVFEIGNLNRVKCSGWWVAGIDTPESVSQHIFRSSAIAFLLAKLEGANAEKSASICLFHDMHEARINDLHKISQAYIDLRNAEIKALQDQVFFLPNKIAENVKIFFNEYNNDASPEGRIARDADLLDRGFMAKEYMKRGYSDAKDWLDNVNKLVITDSAKKLAKMIYDSDPNEWWHGLKKIER